MNRWPVAVVNFCPRYMAVMIVSGSDGFISINAYIPLWSSDVADVLVPCKVVYYNHGTLDISPQ